MVMLFVRVCVYVCVFVTKHVITISQGRNDCHFSFWIYRFVMLRGKTLLFMVEVKGLKTCNHDISSWEGLTLCIFGI